MADGSNRTQYNVVLLMKSWSGAALKNVCSVL